MKNMPNIRVSDDELKLLTTKRVYSSGRESYICLSPNKKTLYKIFRRGVKVVPMKDNKKKKIMRLHDMSLEHTVQILSTISCNGELIGYETSYDKDDFRFYPPLFSRSQLIEKLKNIQGVLEYFNAQDITYGDVSFRNILYNRKTGNLKFCDLDNIRVGEYPIDLFLLPLKNYKDIRGIDDSADAYMHSLLTLKAFDLQLFFSSPEEFNKEFEPFAVEKIIPTLIEPQEYEGEYIVKYVKKRRG